MPSRLAPWLRLLPLLLLAAMIAIGFGIEAVVYDEVAWLAKLRTEGRTEGQPLRGRAG